jgi:hypothetical protein
MYKLAILNSGAYYCMQTRRPPRTLKEYNPVAVEVIRAKTSELSELLHLSCFRKGKAPFRKKYSGLHILATMVSPFGKQNTQAYA